MILHGLDCDGLAHHFPGGDPEPPIIGSRCYCGELEWVAGARGAYVRTTDRSWWGRNGAGVVLTTVLIGALVAIAMTP